MGLLHALNNGTTSACAENTAVLFIFLRSQGNYLRVRGEYVTLPRWAGGCTELPPRARRILIIPAIPSHCFGTTSACAENTPAPARSFA